MAFAPIDLPYAFDALEPIIDARTMELHYGKHHAGYASNLNLALRDSPLAGKSLSELLALGPDALPAAVRNNAGGVANHDLFWQVMKPGGSSLGAGPLARALEARFGDLASFRETFQKAALGRFGSGWAWLALGPQGLEVYSTPNQDSPLLEGKQPLLGLDVWEHAYYLKYQNRRADYVSAWWEVLNWGFVEERYAALTAG